MDLKLLLFPLTLCLLLSYYNGVYGAAVTINEETETSMNSGDPNPNVTTKKPSWLKRIWKKFTNKVTDSTLTKVNVTEDDPTTKLEEEKPGWIRRTLYKFGQMATNVVNKAGKGTTKLNNMIDKLCQIMKMVMPVVSAVCQVGQFQFCAATEAAPQEFPQAIASKSINLDELDK